MAPQFSGDASPPRTADGKKQRKGLALPPLQGEPHVFSDITPIDYCGAPLVVAPDAAGTGGAVPSFAGFGV